MPNPNALPPSERTLMWRKVHMRLAMLGLMPGHIVERIGAQQLAEGRKRHTVSLWLQRRWNQPSLVGAELRRDIEDALALPTGALSDGVPLGAVGLCPIPGYFQPGIEHKSPADHDVAEGGDYSSTMGVLQMVAASVPQSEALLAPIVPPLVIE